VAKPRTDTGRGFRDRAEAGRALVARLEAYRGRLATVVLGLPRGGVVPAAEIATALALPLDVVIVRKLGAPRNPELAIGAVAEGGERYLDEENAALTGASDGYVAAEVAHKRAEIVARQERFRHGRPLTLPDRATAILVDDGVATGSTVIAAIHAVRRLRPAHLVLAVPVAPPETAEVLRRLVDELVVLSTPLHFAAVGQFYDEFPQVSDDQVCDLLARAAAEGRALGAEAAAPGGAPVRPEARHCRPRRRAQT
jgi:putative phosphoribosyl transferase